VVDAHWERRNLGVACTEITVDAADGVEALRSALAPLEEGYHVVRVPTPRVDLLLFLQEAGFASMETVLRLRMRLGAASFPRLYARYERLLGFRHAAGPDDMQRILAEVDAGVFANDRISLDPRFGAAHSALRYHHWIEDEVRRGSLALVTTFKSEDIGFSILRDEGQGRFDALFGALYRERRNSALGFAVGWTNIARARELGGSMIQTTVSTNNLAALKMNLSIGYEVADVLYVAVRHASSDLAPARERASTA
jgi:hypothetical protein